MHTIQPTPGGGQAASPPGPSGPTPTSATSNSNRPTGALNSTPSVPSSTSRSTTEVFGPAAPQPSDLVPRTTEAPDVDDSMGGNENENSGEGSFQTQPQAQQPDSVARSMGCTEYVQQDTSPRVIDENTDLSTLTDQEIMQLTVDIKETEANQRPLISAPVPLSILSSEYAASSPNSENIQKKLGWLERNGWDMVWRARGDGDCFYRSFMLAYFCRILYSENPELEANLAFSNLQSALPLLEQANFDMDLIQDFMEPMYEGIRRFAESGERGLPTEYEIIEGLQNPEKSNSIVVVLRLLTSAYLRSNEAFFTPFLMHPETFQPIAVTDFCLSEVEPTGKEADQAQIMALARCLKQGIRICYLDGSETGDEEELSKVGEKEMGRISFVVEFEVAEGEGVGTDPLMLLYRPGHYDVLTKDHPPTGSMLDPSSSTATSGAAQ